MRFELRVEGLVRVQPPIYKEALKIDAAALIGSFVGQDLQSQIWDIVLQDMINPD